MELTLDRQAILKKHIALPQDHGSWVFLLSPLLIGLFAGGVWGPAVPFLILAAMSAFLIRQPVTIAVKAYSGRRPKRELPAAWFWIAVYGLLGLVGVAGLAWLGHGYLMILALPGLPVFAWHLALVSRRAERRQLGLELVGSGILALAAPAAYWVARGYPDPMGWWLFALTWMQSTASIVYAYLRLEQRVQRQTPPVAGRLRMGARSLAYATFNLAAVASLSLAGVLPALLPIPFALQWAECIYGTLRPATGVKPTRIGIRQLIVSSLFTLLFILAWALSA